MVRLFAFVTALLASVPALADTTALYKAPQGAQMSVEIASNGNMRATVGSGGTYMLTPANRDTYAQNFTKIAYRLAVGEVGVAAYHRSKSPFGWHVIKRIE